MVANERNGWLSRGIGGEAEVCVAKQKDGWQRRGMGG
jgi:hypothetical protein